MIARRVRYREGQMLGEADLRAEQDYLLAVGRRHNVSLHDWGIVTGLGVEVDAQGVRVHRGLAIDGFGRELILRTRLFVGWGTPAGVEIQTYGDWAGGAATGEKQGGIGVWLQYGLSADSSAARPSSCGPGRHVRWAEDPRLVFTPWVPSDPRRPPPGVDSDTPSWLRDVAADQGDLAWPVLLAWLTRDTEGAYQVDAGQCLPHARLVAAAVQSCSATDVPEPAAPPPTSPPPVVNTRVDLARQMGSGRRLFAVRTADRLGADRDRLRIESDGAATFDGAVTFVRLEGHTRPGSDLDLDDARFAAEDVTDPAGLICFIRNTDVPVARYLVRVHDMALDRQQKGRQVAARLAPQLERAGAPLALRLEQIESLSAAPQRQELATLLDDLAGNLADTFAVQIADGIAKGERFELKQFGGVALRKDTWEAIRLAPDAKGALGHRRLATLLIADLMSPYVEISRQQREGAWGLEFRPTAPPKEARPWTIYRTDVKKDDASSRQLRVEMAMPAGEAGLDASRLAIGCYPDTKFQPCLTVDVGGTVTVYGDLFVEGRLIEAPVPPDPGDPRFVSEVIDTWLRGLVGGVAAASTLSIEFLDLVSAKTDTPWPYDVKLTNTGNVAVAEVRVFESLGINQQVLLPRPIATFASLGVGASKTINVTHSNLTETSGQITVAVSAIGVGSTLGLMVAVKLKTVNIVNSVS